ncbi:MAG TPA: CCA tRNA nucleotidyltransferase [Xanthobacteraceae bacterium]|nr:CCA tRNA nucleotidyltransferase [Xanthobacteraceae bacterium]
MNNAVPLNDTTWLTQGPLAKLLAVLDRDGEEARVVGGAVRNVLLGHAPGDIDVATTALPEEVTRRAAAAGFRPVPTGVEHGTVTLVIDGTGFEVTTLREDVETFGRKARVRFGRSWQKDAERRDFTFNALSVSRDGTVHDPVGGIEDLKQHRVRFIGDAAMRIAEDYLRILRFFRFHAAYGRGAPDPDGLHASIAAREGLRQLSRERLRAELLKLLIAPQAAPTLAVMAEAGLLDPVLGGVPYLAGVANVIAVEAVLGLEPDPLRRLAGLAVSVTEDAERLWQRLRLANVEHERLASMADGWWRIDAAIGETGARALLYRLGPARYLDRIVLAWARAGAEAADVAWRELATLPERWQAPVFPLKAADLIARGVPKGPQLGRALAAAEEKWIAAGFPNAAPALQRILDDAARGDEAHSGARRTREPGTQEH